MWKAAVRLILAPISDYFERRVLAAGDTYINTQVW